MKKLKRIFSIDAETNGLWGNPFSVAGIVYDIDENNNFTEIDRICLRLPNSFVTDSWVIENVLPTLNFKITHIEYEKMLKDFADFYLKYKEATVIYHMGHIVETHLFRELHKIKAIGYWDAPYAPLEVAEYLRMVNKDSDSVDNYAEEFNLTTKENNTHNPLYDCEVTAIVLEDILKKL